MSGLTGLSMSSRPWNLRPDGPNEGQKFANELAREKGARQDYGSPHPKRLGSRENGHCQPQALIGHEGRESMGADYSFRSLGKRYQDPLFLGIKRFTITASGDCMSKSTSSF